MQPEIDAVMVNKEFMQTYLNYYSERMRKHARNAEILFGKQLPLLLPSKCLCSCVKLPLVALPAAAINEPLTAH